RAFHFHCFPFSLLRYQDSGSCWVAFSGFGEYILHGRGEINRAISPRPLVGRPVAAGTGSRRAEEGKRGTVEEWTSGRVDKARSGPELPLFHSAALIRLPLARGLPPVAGSAQRCGSRPGPARARRRNSRRAKGRAASVRGSPRRSAPRSSAA